MLPEPLFHIFFFFVGLKSLFIPGGCSSLANHHTEYHKEKIRYGLKQATSQTCTSRAVAPDS